VLSGLLVAAYFIIPQIITPKPDADGTSLSMHTIDVGDGDAIVAELPDNKILMIDTGKNNKWSTVKNYLDTKIFGTRGSGVIDYFVNTHPDDDHYGGMKNLMNAFTIKTIYYPAVDKITMTQSKRDTYNDIINRAHEETNDVRVPTAGEQIDGAEYRIIFHSPSLTDAASMKGTGSTVENAISIMMTLEYKNKVFVLTGDAIKESESVFMTKSTAQNIFNAADMAGKQVILKVGHHGSSTSTGQTFAEFIFAKSGKENCFAIISCGTGYGFPKQSVIDTLNLYCADGNIFITKDSGNILIFSSAGSFFVNGEKFDIGYLSIYVCIGAVIITLCFYNYKRRS
jgi:competence protein ComEC